MGRKFYLIGMLAGLTLMVWGIVGLLQVRTVGDLMEIDVKSLEPENEPPSRYLRIRGRALTQFAFKPETRGEDRYVPLVSDEWQANQPISLFLKTTAPLPEKTQASTFQGLITQELLPGDVKHEFQNRGLNLSETSRVLEVDRTPQDDFLKGLIAAIVGLIIFIGNAVLTFVRPHAE